MPQPKAEIPWITWDTFLLALDADLNELVEAGFLQLDQAQAQTRFSLTKERP